MKDIIKSLDPAVKRFAKELSDEKDKLISLQESLEKEIESVVAERKVLKAQQSENNKRTKEYIDKLNEAKEKQGKLNASLGNEIIKYHRLEKDLLEAQRKVDQELKSMAVERELIQSELKKAKDKLRLYNDKIELLKIDYEDLEKKREELHERNRQFVAKERNVVQRENAVTDREINVAERENGVKIEERRIKHERSKLGGKHGA